MTIKRVTPEFPSDEMLPVEKWPERQPAPLNEETAPLHDCGWPQDSFACKIRHIHMNTGVAKAGGVAAPGKPQHVEITPNGRVIR